MLRAREADAASPPRVSRRRTLQGVVTLNVGGQHFETRRQTLEGSESYFAALLRSELRSEEDDEVLFVDRDPTHFRHVLNYLRGSATFPAQPHELQQLAAEADFYCLHTYAHQLVAEKKKREALDVARTLSVIASRIG